MNIPEAYGYLIRARRDLWTALATATENVLCLPVLDGPRFRCIKDLLFHIPDVEDGWIHGDILREPMVQHSIPTLWNSKVGDHAGIALAELLEYWRLVEQHTLGYLATLTAGDWKRVVPVDDWPGKLFTLEGLLWHVMIHEMRHTAQICTLLRIQGIKPPSLDLLFYLPLDEEDED